VEDGVALKTLLAEMNWTEAKVESLAEKQRAW
jgi:hypothetical protein